LRCSQQAAVIRTESARAARRASETAENYAAKFADVFGHLSDLANCFKVDLEKAFRAKEHLNQGPVNRGRNRK